MVEQRLIGRKWLVEEGLSILGIEGKKLGFISSKKKKKLGMEKGLNCSYHIVTY